MLNASVFGASSPVETFEVDFDGLISKEFLASGLKNKHSFIYTRENSGETKLYIGTISFHDDGYYLFGVVVAPAPMLLDSKSYCAAFRQAKKRFDGQENRFRHQFPPGLGSRAQRVFDGAGPAGSGYALVFTTSDGKYDIKVIVAMSLPESVADPGFDIDRIAETVSRHYDAHTHPYDESREDIFQCQDD